MITAMATPNVCNHGYFTLHSYHFYFRLLQYAITPNEIRKQETGNVFTRVAANKVGRPIVWNFVQSKWDYIHDE